MSALIRVLNSQRNEFGNIKFNDVLSFKSDLKMEHHAIYYHLYHREILPCCALLPLDMEYEYKIYWNEQKTKNEVNDDNVLFVNSEESSNKIDDISQFLFN